MYRGGIDDPQIRSNTLILLDALTHLPHSDLEVKEYTEKFSEDTSATSFSFKTIKGDKIAVIVGWNLIAEADWTAQPDTKKIIGFAFLAGKDIRQKGVAITFVPNLAVDMLRAFAEGRNLSTLEAEK